MHSVLLAAALFQAGAAPIPSTGSPSEILATAGEALVKVRYVLEQEGAEFGGFTQRNHMTATGIVVHPRGRVLVGGEIFPEEDFGLDGTQRLVDFEVVTGGETVLAADLVGFDPGTNLAFVQVRDKGRYPFIDFDNPPTPAVGESVFLVGKLAEGFGGSQVIKSVSVAGTTEEEFWVFDDIPDVRFLGGPVFDGQGRPIGFVGIRPTPPGIDPQLDPAYFPTFLMTVPQGKRFGLPVGIPAASIRRVMGSPPPLPAPGGPDKAWIGITLQPVSRELADFWELPESSGIAVTSVIQGSPAERAGLRVGDVLLRFDGTPAAAQKDEELDAFIRRVQKTDRSRPVEIELMREGRVRKLEVALGEAPRPMRTAPYYISADFGIKVRDLTFDFAQMRNLPWDLKGVVVEELETGGWAQVGGLAPGDVVLEVQQEPVPDVGAFQEALELARRNKLREVVFFVQRGPNTTFVSIRTDY